LSKSILLLSKYKQLDAMVRVSSTLTNVLDSNSILNMQQRKKLL